jgi:hypothetical protein
MRLCVRIQGNCSETHSQSYQVTMDGVCRRDMSLPAQSPCENYDAHKHDTMDVFYQISLHVANDNDINDHQLFQSLR